MKKLFIVFLFIPSIMVGQIKFDLGVDGGICFSNPQINYENTTLYNLYEFTALSFPNNSYSFEQFKGDYQIKDIFYNPVFGLNGEIWSEKIPLFIGTSISTSPSSLQKQRCRIFAGIKKNFYFAESWNIQLKASYGYVIDRGLGSKTLISSIGDDTERNLAESFFQSKVIPQDGYLLSFSPSILKNFGSFSVGLNGFYNLDLTDKLKRGNMRMNNFGLNVTGVFHL
jgi:hypothetical protein